MAGKQLFLWLSPIEKEYLKKYGQHNEIDYERLYKEKGADIANKTIQDRMDMIWADMLAREYFRKKAEQQSLKAECSF